MDDFTDRYGPWALVAGGSEGLGLAFCRLVVERGSSVLVVAHQRGALDAAVAELRALPGARDVVGVLADLATSAGVDTALAACEDREVGLLVANAAVSPRGDFLDADPEELARAIAVNVAAPVRLTHALGQGMRERGRGGIVLVSSLSSLQGTAVFSTYAGTKAFLRIQAEGLWYELGPHGVDVVSVVPGTIDTPGLRSSAPRGGPRPMAPRDVARSALDGLGHGPVVFPRWRDAATAGLMGRVLGRRRAVKVVSDTTRRMYAPR